MISGYSDRTTRFLSTAFRLHFCFVERKLHYKKFLYSLDINTVNKCEMVKISLLLLGLLGEDVAVVSVLPLDFSRSGKRETLFGTGVGLKLCHFTKIFN